MTNADGETDETQAIEDHDDLDAETLFEDAKELFEPDNTDVPPASPDAPPPAD